MNYERIKVFLGDETAALDLITFLQKDKKATSFKVELLLDAVWDALVATFDGIDVNKDGKLSYDEIKAVMTLYGAGYGDSGEKTAKYIIGNVDFGHDAQVSKDELMDIGSRAQEKCLCFDVCVCVSFASGVYCFYFHFCIFLFHFFVVFSSFLDYFDNGLIWSNRSIFKPFTLRKML